MGIFIKHSKISFKALFKKYFLDENYISEDQLGYLVDLVRTIRPKKMDADVTPVLDAYIAYLTENPEQKKIIANYLVQLFSSRKLFNFLSNAGILRDSFFMLEVKKRLFARILPEQPGIASLEYILVQVFYKHDDYKWLLKIPDAKIIELNDIFGFQSVFKEVTNYSLIGQITTSLSVLGQRITGRVMEYEVIKMVPEYDHFNNLFESFENELQAVLKKVRVYKPHYISSSDENYLKTKVQLQKCYEFVDLAFKNSSKYGISMKVNQSLLRIRQQLQRIESLLEILIVNHADDQILSAIKAWRLIIKLNSIKNNVGQLINESTQLISYEITKHTAITGEKYITETRSEYYHMLKASLGGGFIVGFLCIFKLLLSGVSTSEFGHAFLYSLNYALGFVVIYLLHYTLATKQPAMTAATLSKTLEEDHHSGLGYHEKYSKFSFLFARLFRSQFIAFIGNVVLAFPVALLLAWLIDLTLHVNIAEMKADKLLSEINPWESSIILYASIAGIYLFISGIISGNVANKLKHENICYRIKENPFLKNTIGAQKASKFADWVFKNWAGIVSNAWFGVFLGCTGTIGVFLGINIDIRHITFASGNFALGLYGKGFDAMPIYLYLVFIRRIYYRIL
ncbi:site-specific recombinase [Flavobacterium agricola]|uniref:Site-specific recombinase n=1 Tax=Flavobacterium agricola TaxID=2870839 RepID=A0ABY6LWZ6_9FLAO|nr:site-specific recombinase [Flavobacterium agricola]UYW00873.1 site-specific recombinase [Flavobacterium agricola]